MINLISFDQFNLTSTLKYTKFYVILKILIFFSIYWINHISTIGARALTYLSEYLFMNSLNYTYFVWIYTIPIYNFCSIEINTKRKRKQSAIFYQLVAINNLLRTLKTTKIDDINLLRIENYVHTIVTLFDIQSLIK